MSSPLGDVVATPFAGAEDNNNGMVAPPQGLAFFEDVKGNYYDGLQNKDGEDHITPGSAVLTDGKARALSDREEQVLLRYINSTQGDKRCILVGVEGLSSAHRVRKKMALQHRNNDQNGGVVINEGGDDNNEHGRDFDVDIGLTWKLEKSMVEVRELIKMSGLVLEAEIVQQLQEVNSKMYIGTRKVGEVQALLGLINEELERNDELLCCTVMFNAKLMPGQQRQQRK
jgi:hypothetical protein